MPCRLYLLTPPELASGGASLSGFRDAFAAALTGGDVAAVLIRADDGRDGLLPELVETLRPIAQAADAAVVLEDRPELAVQLRCDGVQVDSDPDQLRAARHIVGRDRILGAACGASRDAAMLAGELGADYVAFEADALETIAWWAELMEVPCVALGGVTLETAPDLIQAGAEFLGVGEAIWSDPAGAAVAVQAFDALAAGSL